MTDNSRFCLFVCLACGGCIGANPNPEPDEPATDAIQQAIGPQTHYDQRVFAGNAFAENFHYETSESCSPGYVRSGTPVTRWTSQVGGSCVFEGWNTPSNPYDCHAKIYARTAGGGFGGTCESWVYEEAVNLAEHRPSTQSSTDFGGDAARAVDGNTDGNFFDNSVTHTSLEAQPWWQVDLGMVTNIGKVILYNRTDCCASRLSNFDILTSNDGSDWQLALNVPGTASNPAVISMSSTGRFVRVRLRGTDYLSLAEVRVFVP
jgi:hypothetical protein